MTLRICSFPKILPKLKRFSLLTFNYLIFHYHPLLYLKNVPEKQQVEENEEWSSVSDDDDEEFSGNESSDDNMDVLPEREANISFGVQDDHQTARNNELDLENLDDEEEADDEEHEDEEDDGNISNF